MQLCEWYKDLKKAHQLDLEHVLSREEKTEIADSSDGGFLKVRKKGRGQGKAAGGATANEWAFGEDVEKVARAENTVASSQSGNLSGGSGVAGGIYAAFNSGLVIDRAQRAEAKKLRRKQEKEEREQEENGVDQRDDLEQQLARGHSTAAPASKIFSQRPQLPKLSEDQIDDFKSVKSLKRALLEREISQEEVDEHSGKPDEVKLLRALAKSLPSVCVEAATKAKMKSRSR